MDKNKHFFNIFENTVSSMKELTFSGYVTSVKGILIECSGIEKFSAIGSFCYIINRNGNFIDAEVVGFSDNKTLLMAFSYIDGVGKGCRVILKKDVAEVFPSDQWKGRVINAMAQPIDSKGELPLGSQGYSLHSKPPPAHSRKRVNKKIDLGVRAINAFTPCCIGQRMGIFAGSGVGKSILMAMLAKYCKADVKVIGLIGERGREVQEFIQDYLGEEGLKDAVVIVATGDETALMRRQAAYLVMSVSEFFRDKGKKVLCLMDSITRFAMAQREIGLSSGEPPSSKGYTPTVFSSLARLLERGGPGVDEGSITSIFSILVEGDDHNEPVADAARGILDGHIVLDREIAERGRFPAINILKSISRTTAVCNSKEENELIKRVKNLLSTYNDMQDLIRLGAYRKGSDPVIDEAIKYFNPLEEFMSQSLDENSSIEHSYKLLTDIFK